METGTNKKVTGSCRGQFDDLASVICSFGYSLPDRFGVDEFVATLESQLTPVMFRLEYEREKKQLFLFPWVRTSSWQFDGERTDIHDIAAIAFSAAVTGGFDIPVSSIYMAGYCGRMEMDTVFVNIHQSRSRGFADDDCGLFEITRIIGSAYFSWKAIQSCEYSKHLEGERTDPTDTGYTWEDVSPWATNIAANLRTHDGLSTSCYSKRRCPSWDYFHDWKKRTVVIRSDRLAVHLKAMVSSQPSRTIQGINGQLIVTCNRRTILPFPAIRRALRLLRTLGDSRDPSSVSVLCLENRVLIGGDSHVVAINCNSGRASFDTEREHVRARFEAEAEILFPATEFVWEAQVPDDAFEAMICELLELERGVLRIRRSGVTRERDGGRDLIAEWIPPMIAPDVGAYTSTLPREPLAVVVQCKASAKTVGKGKVQDIRDTVEHYAAKGYFLAVSSQISGPLIAHLENLKKNDWFVDWWTRLEIEARLRKHPDVADRYCVVVRRIGDGEKQGVQGSLQFPKDGAG